MQIKKNLRAALLHARLSVLSRFTRLPLSTVSILVILPYRESSLIFLSQGDSGGPLIVNKKLVGLVSWAKACSLTEYPTVYTRVPAYVNWIKWHAV